MGLGTNGSPDYRITGKLAQLRINGKTATEIELIPGNQRLVQYLHFRFRVKLR